MVIDLKQGGCLKEEERVINSNLIPSLSTKNNLLSLSEQRIENKHFLNVRDNAIFANISHMSTD